MFNGINIDIFKGSKAESIANDIDRRYVADNYLRNFEISLFLAKCEENNIKIEDESWYHQYADIFEKAKKDISQKHVERVDVIQLRPELVLPHKIEKTTTTEAKTDESYKNEYKSRNPEFTEKEFKEWMSVISKEANKYGVPEEILFVIIGRECHYMDPHLNKNPRYRNSNGCMQVTVDTLRNIKNPYGPFRKANEECYQDLKKNLKTKSLKDRHTGIKAGIMVLSYNYLDIISKYEKGYKRGDVATVRADLESGKLNLSPNKVKQYLKTAFQWYNGSKHKIAYANDLINRLDRMGFDYKEGIVNKQD